MLLWTQEFKTGHEQGWNSEDEVGIVKQLVLFGFSLKEILGFSLVGHDM